MKAPILTRFVLITACAFIAVPLSRAADAPPAAKRPPNIVLILSDDVGYGDVGCYGATRVKTPNIDRLAAEGVRFTDAHATSATCTPSRYSLLTGQYAWRRKGTGILPGDASLIIDPASPTLPSLLRSAGYATAAVGKWHLGLGKGKVDWNGEIAPGPLEVGFDESFIIPATGDRVPCVFIEGHHVVGFDPNDPIAVSYGIKVGDWPTGRENPDLLTLKPSEGHADTIINGISRIGFQTGGKKALWKDDEIADTLTARALGFIERSAANADKPFFLYFATHDIHVPRVPAPRFRGTSGCGIRGDAIQELDWSVGQVMDRLEKLNIADNTLVLFSSDNGPVVDDGYADGSVENLNGHKPAGPWRGGKYTIWEGGTRMPFITRWPGRIAPGTCDAMLSQIDLIASLVPLAGGKVPEGAAPDSVNLLSVLLGESKEGRKSLIEQGGGYNIALRQGQLKFISPTLKPGAKPGPRGQSGEPQLYDLAADPGETNNLAASQPEKVKELAGVIEAEKNK